MSAQTPTKMKTKYQRCVQDLLPSFLNNIYRLSEMSVCHSTFPDKYFIFYVYIYSQPLPYFIQQFGNKAVFSYNNVPMLYFTYVWDGWAEPFKVRKAHSHDLCITYYYLNIASQSISSLGTRWISELMSGDTRLTDTYTKTTFSWVKQWVD